MKFKKLLSSFLSVAMCMSTFTFAPYTAFASAETYTVTQSIFELDAEAIENGNVPAGVEVSSIIDTDKTSAETGLVSTVQTAETDFIKIDFAGLIEGLQGTDTGLYTIEIISNLQDSDDAKNGTSMYVNGSAKKLLTYRARETSDFSVVADSWGTSGVTWNKEVNAATALYRLEDLNLSDGSAASHIAKRGNTNQYSTAAQGQALSACSITGVAPINGLIIKAAAGYRASIKSLKIYRKVTLSSDEYIKKTETVFNAADILSGNTTTGVTVANLDTVNSTSNAILSNVTDASTDFITVDFSKLPDNGADVVGNDYNFDLNLNFVDSDDTTKNGALVYFNEVSTDVTRMLFRARETRDGTIYSNGTNTISGQLGTQVYPKLRYSLYFGATDTIKQELKHGESGNYAFSNALSRGTALELAGPIINKIIIRNPDYNSGGVNENYRVNINTFTITRDVYIRKVYHTVNAVSENNYYGTVAIEGLTDGQVLNGESVTLTATANDGCIFKGWYKEGEEVATSTEKIWTFAVAESANYTAKFALAREATQTVYEMDAASLEAGTVLAGVTFNTDILDENASTAEALVSDVVATDTAFLTVDLAELSKSLPGEDTGLYTIEIITNVDDSVSETKNGTLMYLKGTSDTLVFRAREDSDICALNNSGWTSGLYWRTETAGTATYLMEDLNITTGEAEAHWLMRGSVVQHKDNANGQALGAGNATETTPISLLTVKAASGRRASIKSLKITRKALVENVTYTINAVTENEAYGSVSITGVSEEEATKGQVEGGAEVTLTATANDGYLFKGWYKEGEDVPESTEKVWTFAAAESANYIARFVESYVANKVVFELDAESLEAGTVPAGVTLNTDILDENASTADSLVSDVVEADTAFLTIDLAKVGINTGDIGSDIYTIELVTNVNDSVSETKNGTLMYLKGTSDTLVFRAREDSDICALNNSGWTSGLYWRTETSGTASYKMENLNVTTGAATAHWLKRGSVAQHANNANGQALGAGNASEETPISILTVKAAKDRRANVKKLVITRQVEIPLEKVNVEVTTENDTYGIVTDIGDTSTKYSEITLKAESKDGYIFAGWYNEDTLVSEANPWTFQVTEGFSYTAKFRKVVDEWVEVYGMDIADILAGATTNGVVISNLDEANSSVANGLISAESDTSADFMTITFANLPVPTVDEAAGDLLTDIYRVDMKLNLVDSDDTTKNGTLVYYNEATSANMLLRARETRDGTFYKDGSATIYGGSVGSQQIPSLAYNFKMDTETGVFNQYVKHGVGDYYLFTDTASRGDDITLPEEPEKIIIRNADYNSGGVNENYRVNIKSLSVKRLVKIVDTGNAVPVFSKERVTVVANSGEIWNGSGEFTTDVEKIVIDFGSEIDSARITQDSVYITCDDVKIYSVPSAELKDGVTLVTLTGMTFEDGKTYKVVANDIVNVRGASLQKEDEYVAMSTKSSYEGITVSGATIGGNAITAASDIAANTEVTVNVAHTNIAAKKDVYVLYVAYKDGTKADIKFAKVENIIGSGNKTATFTTGNVSDVEEINFIIWEGWNSMKIFDSFGF